MTGFALKLIAAVTMLIDHTGHVIFPGVMWLRYIGRLSFPIYCFLLVEGFFHTRDLKRYMLRLFIFAVISEMPFDLATCDAVFTLEHQNVFWTLLLGLMAISAMDLIKHESLYLRMLLQAAVLLPFAVTAQLIHSDYRWVGVCLIASMYLFRDLEPMRVATGAFLMLPFFTNEIEYVGVLAYLPMHFYNGRQGGSGSRIQKLGFYIFYPVHLLTLVFIRDKLWNW
ncbi:MAG: TraX protein [Lachnospiraceae bacterium]|nr:TraX protein [Lachnospiraceae bacterium]